MDEINELYEEITEGDDYKEVTSATITDQSRWHTFYEQVFKKVSDDTYWQMNWHRGSTETQDYGPEDIEICEVEPKEVTVIKYVRKK